MNTTVPVVHITNKSLFGYGSTVRSNSEFSLVNRVKRLVELILSFDQGWGRTCRNIALLAITVFIGYHYSFRIPVATLFVLKTVNYLNSRFKITQALAKLFLNSEAITDLYVWRHGQTNANVSEVLSGGGDTQAVLTEQGHDEAIELAKKISSKSLGLEVVYSSDLRRAMQTAKKVVTNVSSTEVANIISAPQLREVLHGRYEGRPAKERNGKASSLFNQELEKMEKEQKDFSKGIKDGKLDRFHFCKIHPMCDRVARTETSIINVDKFFASKSQEPETVYELFLRSHAEFVRIADESHACGLSTVGISTHGAVISTLINVATHGNKNVFVPPFYQTGEIQRGKNTVMPASSKIDNCALAHFRYRHTSKRLEFCGMVD